MCFESLMAVVGVLDCVRRDTGGLGRATAVPTEWARRGFARARSAERRGGAIDPQLLEGVEKNQQAAALALIRTRFRQALDLPENPERVPGWSYQGPGHSSGKGTGVASHPPMPVAKLAPIGRGMATEPPPKVMVAARELRQPVSWPVQYLRAAPEGSQPRVAMDLENLESCFEEQPAIPKR